MDTKNKLNDLNREALEKVENYIKEKGIEGLGHHDKIYNAKEEWQLAWNKLMETMLILEKI
jgi:CRISPR/Cas system-associated protein Cas10 (large subunit of type III CRISPR-Cas system)